jgi:hypothetical protein
MSRCSPQLHDRLRQRIKRFHNIELALSGDGSGRIAKQAGLDVRQSDATFLNVSIVGLKALSIEEGSVRGKARTFLVFPT